VSRRAISRTPGPYAPHSPAPLALVTSFRGNMISRKTTRCHMHRVGNRPRKYIGLQILIADLPFGGPLVYIKVIGVRLARPLGRESP
jgi:hypothetical protein